MFDITGRARAATIPAYLPESGPPERLRRSGENATAPSVAPARLHADECGHGHPQSRLR